MTRSLLFSALIILSTIANGQDKDSTYFRKQQEAGVKRILIDNRFWVWTRKIGDGKINVLLLHGGPAQSHEYFEIFEKYLSPAGITIYYYDQFGSYFSQTPSQAQLDDTSIWKVSRYVDEIEQIRKGLAIDKWYVLGHSYGALLALAYTHRFQDHVRGLVFSDMDPYPAELGENMDRANIAIDSLLANNPRYRSIVQNKIKGLPYDSAIYRQAFESSFERNLLVRLDTLPDALVRTKKHKNFEVAQKIGPSVFSLDYASMIPDIRVPVLVIAGKYDFPITPAEVSALARKFKDADYYITPNGGHISFVDDPAYYFPVLIKFIKDRPNAKLR